MLVKFWLDENGDRVLSARVIYGHRRHTQSAINTPFFGFLVSRLAVCCLIAAE
jgi:hypothetical protein